MDLFEALAGDVSVYLRSGKVRVPEHDLDTAQVSPILQEVSGKRVSQRVG